MQEQRVFSIFSCETGAVNHTPMVQSMLSAEASRIECSKMNFAWK